MSSKTAWLLRIGRRTSILTGNDSSDAHAETRRMLFVAATGSAPPSRRVPVVDKQERRVSGSILRTHARSGRHTFPRNAASRELGYIFAGGISRERRSARRRYSGQKKGARMRYDVLLRECGLTSIHSVPHQGCTRDASVRLRFNHRRYA